MKNLKMKLDFSKKDERIEFRLSPLELHAFMEEAKKVKANKTQFFRFLIKYYLENKNNEGKK